MRSLVLAATTVLVVLGIENHAWWLAAVTLLCLYVRHGRGSPGTAPPTTGTPAPPPDSYRAYRDRRDRQAKWERRYRRERPLEARRQERGKAK